MIRLQLMLIILLSFTTACPGMQQVSLTPLTELLEQPVEYSPVNKKFHAYLGECINNTDQNIYFLTGREDTIKSIPIPPHTRKNLDDLIAFRKIIPEWAQWDGICIVGTRPDPIGKGSPYLRSRVRYADPLKKVVAWLEEAGTRLVKEEGDIKDLSEHTNHYVRIFLDHVIEGQNLELSTVKLRIEAFSPEIQEALKKAKAASESGDTSLLVSLPGDLRLIIYLEQLEEEYGKDKS